MNNENQQEVPAYRAELIGKAIRDALEFLDGYCVNVYSTADPVMRGKMDRLHKTLLAANDVCPNKIRR